MIIKSLFIFINDDILKFKIKLRKLKSYLSKVRKMYIWKLHVLLIVKDTFINAVF